MQRLTPYLLLVHRKHLGRDLQAPFLPRQGLQLALAPGGHVGPNEVLDEVERRQVPCRLEEACVLRFTEVGGAVPLEDTPCIVEEMKSPALRVRTL